VLSGVVAGILAAKVNLSLLEDYFPLIFGILVAINIALIAMAIKRGRIP
jgi:uncharacterized membrane protein YgaE (UPF0421/DUF939 family)